VSKQMNQNTPLADLDKEEDFLYAHISREPIVLDEIIEKTSFDIARASNLLLNLQLKKLIRQLPGKQFIRN